MMRLEISRGTQCAKSTLAAPTRPPAVQLEVRPIVGRFPTQLYLSIAESRGIYAKLPGDVFVHDWTVEGGVGDTITRSFVNSTSSMLVGLDRGIRQPRQ